MNQVFAFEVSVIGFDWSRIVNSSSRGKAKSEYLADVRESWPDVTYTDLRCKKIGPPETSEQFVRNAIYRGLPEVRCGDRVKVGKAIGTIVGHNSSANFDVLFDEDSVKYAGLKLNVHPSSIELVRDE